MENTKYNATWVSHSSIGDFLKCPKAYYLHYVYKSPKSNHKIQIINPALALGQIVHKVLESLSIIKAEERLKVPLTEIYDKAWQEITGKKGGFKSKDEEEKYKTRGRLMLERVMKNPGPLINKAVTLPVLNPSFPLPWYYLSETENIILSGKIDWMEYVPAENSVHIIDFKTGKHEEDPNSLQLDIYCLLVKNLQKRNIHNISYWYLETENSPKQMKIPDLNISKEKILDIARKIKVSKANHEFNCPTNGCYVCKPYMAIINGDGEQVGVSGYQDIFII